MVFYCLFKNDILAKVIVSKYVMKFSEYQEKSRVTALYPDKDNNFIYPTLGLVGESGEIAEKIKKVLRDDGGKLSEDKKIEIGKELGDVLWYISQLATELDMNLDEIAQGNIDKLYSRLDRGVIGGSGDNR
jgi:NTP pyrophosphatase (non-canonical NTP hydrolase)